MAALAQSNAQLGDLSQCHHRTSARPSSAGVGLQLGQLLCCIWVGWFFWGGGGSTMSQSSERSAWAPQKLCLTSQPDSVSLVRGDPASSCAGGAAQHLLGSHWAQREGNPQGTSAQCQRRGALIQPRAGGSGWAAGTAEPCQAESPLMWLSVTPGEVPSPPPPPATNKGSSHWKTSAGATALILPYVPSTVCISASLQGKLPFMGSS